MRTSYVISKTEATGRGSQRVRRNQDGKTIWIDPNDLDLE